MCTTVLLQAQIMAERDLLFRGNGCLAVTRSIYQLRTHATPAEKGQEVRDAAGYLVRR